VEVVNSTLKLQYCTSKVVSFPSVMVPRPIPGGVLSESQNNVQNSHHTLLARDFFN
jgi:hypothetical protein